MKVFLPFLAFILTLGQLSGITLNELTVSFETATLKQNHDTLAQKVKLNEGYTKALERLKSKLQQNGDLDKALQLKNEIELIAAATWPLPGTPEKADSRMVRLRETYLKNYVEIEKKWAKAITAIAEKMEAALQGQVEELTKSGKLELAKKAREQLTAISTDPEILRAKDLPNRFSRSGQARVAHVVRRSGDNLEVRVRFDGSGKVSMDSPVENVIEQTDGRRERGKTAAKNLGEFLGAENYQSQPFVAADFSAGKGNLKISGGNGVLTGASKQGDLECVEFKISPTAAGPYFDLPANLPNSPGSTTHEIEVEYFIPSDNKQVNSFALRQGDSRGKNIGANFTTSGKWVTEKRSSVSSHTLGTVRFYFGGIKKTSQARGDRLYLRSLKVTYLRFPAFVVESFDKQGSATTRQVSPGEQKPLALDGVLVEEK